MTESVKTAIGEAGDRGCLLAPFCVIDASTLEANLLAARKAVNVCNDKYQNYISTGNLDPTHPGQESQQDANTDNKVSRPKGG